MFYPEKMVRVTVAAPKKHMKEVIAALYELSVLHIKSHVPKGAELPIGEPFGEAEAVSGLLLELQAIKNHIPLTPSASQPGLSLTRISQTIAEAKREVLAAAGGLKEAEAMQRDIGKRLDDLRFLRSAGINELSLVQPSASIAGVFGYAEDMKGLKALEDAALFASESGHAFALFCKKGDEESIRKEVAKAGFRERKMELHGEGKVEEEILKAQEGLKRTERKKVMLQQKLDGLAKKYGDNLYLAEETLVERLRKSEAPLKFAVSSYAFIVSGWLPAKNERKLVERLQAISRGIFIKTEKAGMGAPTKISNPGPLKPFEFFLRLYSLPGYKEVDPTFLIFITFPLFYGFMLGDIGYGAILLALGTAAKLAMKRFRSLIDITIVSSILTIIFGFIYGEFFGSEQILGYHLTPYFHRLEHATQLITVSVMIGLVHINLGFMFGIINYLREGHLLHAIGKAGWVSLQAGALLYLLDFMKLMPFDSFISLLILMASVIIILLGEGFISVVEIPTLLSNILSYARLAAIGLASASIALAVNRMAGGMFAKGDAVSAAIAVAALALGHTGNLLLGLVDANLQSLRLHYVEQFTKFYHGSGKPYRPFGKGYG